MVSWGGIENVESVWRNWNSTWRKLPIRNTHTATQKPSFLHTQNVFLNLAHLTTITTTSPKTRLTQFDKLNFQFKSILPLHCESSKEIIQFFSCIKYTPAVRAKFGQVSKWEVSGGCFACLSSIASCLQLSFCQHRRRQKSNYDLLKMWLAELNLSWTLGKSPPWSADSAYHSATWPEVTCDCLTWDNLLELGSSRSHTEATDRTMLAGKNFPIDIIRAIRPGKYRKTD